MTKYYISTGAKTKMYTLRVVEIDPITKMESDWYMCNLSTDWDKAVEKANSQTNGGLVNPDEFSLFDIRRRKQEEVRAANVASAEEHERQMHERFENFNWNIEHGVFPFGKYQSVEMKVIAERDPGYMRYLVNSVDASDESEPFNSVMRNLQRHLFDKFPNETRPLPVPNGEYYNFTQKREQMTAMCIARFGFDGYYGWTDIIKLVKDSGELIMYMGSGNIPFVEGSTYEFTAGFKGHDTYGNDDEKQTFIQRITKVSEVI